MTSLAPVAAPGTPLLGLGFSPERPLFRPPPGLLQKVRWLCLLALGAVLVAVGAQGVTATMEAGGLWPVALVVPIGLLAVWLHAYARGGYTPVHDIISVALLVAGAAVVPTAQPVQWMVIGTIWQRILYASGREAVAVTALYGATVAVNGLISPAAPTPGQTLGRIILIVVGGAVFSLIGSSLGGYERSISRERRLREAGTALVSANSRAAIYDATLAGARSLLAGARGAGVAIAIGGEADMAVVAEAGEGTAHAHGRHIHVDHLPPAVHDSLHAGRPVEVDHAAATLWDALALEHLSGKGGTLFALPLVAQGAFEGAIVVGSDRPLDAELKDDLETLADLAALAIESQILIEARAAGQPIPAAVAAQASPASLASDAAGTSATPDAGETAGRSLASLIRMPHDLAGRVRWLFLAGAVLETLWICFSQLAQPVMSPAWVATVTAPFWLTAWWVYGHRRRAFPVVGDVVVSALLTLVMTLPGDPAGTLIYLSMFFRALYGSRANVALAFVLHAVALLAAELIAPTGDTPLLLVVQVAELAAFAAFVHFVSWTLGRSERAMARERILRDTGRALVAATDSRTACAAVVDGAWRLLDGTSGAAVALALAATGNIRVAGARGIRSAPGAAGTAGDGAFTLDALPAPIQSVFSGDSPAELRSADPAAFRAIDPARSAGALYAVPLRTRGEHEGAVLVVSDAPLDAELKDDLETLADLAALVVEDMALREGTPA